MKVLVYAIVYNEAKMIPWFLRHYSAIADRIIIYCEPSDDGTEDLVRACPKAELRVWPYKGLDDEVFLMAVNNWYKEARGEADWVCWPDADELLWHPSLRDVLESSKYDVIPSTGYALISPGGWPADDGRSQIYDLVKTGVAQPNYSKKILWRPELDITFQIGRHTYPGWPRHNGKESPDVGLKLLHCHFVGGVHDTAIRNQRCYDRAPNKVFAWNYTKEHNKPEQVGTSAWVEDVVTNGKLEKVL